MRTKAAVIAFGILSLGILGGYIFKKDNERKHLRSMLAGHPVSPLKRLEISYKSRENAVTISNIESMRYLQNLKYSPDREIEQFNGPSYTTYFVFDDGTRARGGIMLIANVFPINTPENYNFFLIFCQREDAFDDPEYFYATLEKPVPADLKKVFDALVDGELPKP